MLRKASPIRIVPVNFRGAEMPTVLASGGVIAARDTIWESGYLDHAYLPKPDWRLLSIDERSNLFQAHSSQIKAEVCVVNVRGERYSKLAEDVARRGVHTGTDARTEQLFRETIEAYVDVEQYHYLGIETTLDSAPTLTWDTDGRRTGLHVDSWSGAAIADRASAVNRMCLNVGAGDRFLLLINEGIDTVREKLAAAGRLDEPYRENVTTLAVCYLELAPRTEVLAVRIRPGEAYIAPTEYVIHDGFVPGRLPNASISVTGHVTLRNI